MHRGADLQKCSPATLSMSILVVVNNCVALDGVNLTDKKTVHVKITSADDKVLEFESLWVWHSLPMISVCAEPLQDSRIAERKDNRLLSWLRNRYAINTFPTSGGL